MKNYYFIGIKGSGMSALALILAELGNSVRGSDIERFIFTETKLVEKNIVIDSFEYSAFETFDIVVVGNAFVNEHPQVIAAKKQNKTILRYHEMLGQLMNLYESYSVAGTHGKTTTTGMLAHTLSAFSPTGYLIGDGTGHLSKVSKRFVVESCEYKRHFLAYAPSYAIVTSAELDHVDYFKDYDDYLLAYEQFIENVDKGIVLFGDDPHVMKIKKNKDVLYYGLQKHNDVRAENIIYSEEGIMFDLFLREDKLRTVSLPFAGEHLLWNSLAVLSIVIIRELDLDVAIEKLKTFEGVKRRFNIEVSRDHVYIDDYAHHPTAIELTIKAAKQKYPMHKVVAIFKPDRYSRIAYFVDEFAHSFSLADEVYICEFPNNTVSDIDFSFTIKELVDKTNKAKMCYESQDEANRFASYEKTVFLFMSSKDIYKFKDEVKKLHNN